jgi:hypothetical protein
MRWNILGGRPANLWNVNKIWSKELLHLDAQRTWNYRLGNEQVSHN